MTNNIIYIANLLALRQWYLHVRGAFPGDREMGEALHRGAMEILDKAVAERRMRFRALAEKMEASMDLAQRLLPEETRGMILSQQRELL